MEDLHNELIAYVLSYMTFSEIGKFRQINKSMGSLCVNSDFIFRVLREKGYREKYSNDINYLLEMLKNMDIKTKAYIYFRKTKLFQELKLDEPVKQMVGSYILTCKGNVYGFKAEDTEAVRDPDKIKCLSDISQISASGNQFICVDYEGNVYIKTWNTPIRTVYGLNDIKYVACSNDNSFCVTESGEVYVFGKNSNGELGLGHANQVDTPKLNPYVKDIKKVFTDRSTAFLTQDGKVFICGYNFNEELCDTLIGGQADNIVIPEQVQIPHQIKDVSFGSFDYTVFYITKNDLIYRSSPDLINPVLVTNPRFEGAIKIVPYGYYIYVLKKNGNIDRYYELIIHNHMTLLNIQNVKDMTIGVTSSYEHVVELVVST